MKKVIRFIKALNPFDLIAFIMIPIIVASVASTLPKLIEIKSLQNIQEKYYEYLYAGMKKNLFNEDFVLIAFNSFDRKCYGALSKYGYIEIIEDFIVYLNTNIENDNPKDVASNRLDSVVKLLNKAKETEPYASLPSEEKRLMNHIQTLLRSNGSQSDIDQSMSELKQVLISRHKEYEKIEAQNAWSMPLAFAGVFFTIIFGIWSIYLSIRKRRTEINRILFSPELNINSDEDAEQGA